MSSSARSYSRASSAARFREGGLLKDAGLTSLYYHKKMKTSAETSLPALLAAKDALSKLDDFSVQGIHDTLIPLASEMGIKNGQLLWPVRVAISGVAVTPGGANEIACLLGKEETLRRLDISIEKLKNM
ncbi:MAG: hypothetical protein ACLVKR_02520 [Lachnospiraceae bacterium]